MITGTFFLLCNIALALGLGWCLGAWFHYPLLGTAGGALAAMGGRIVWGRQGRVRNEAGEYFYPTKGLPSYEQLRITAVFILEMAVVGWLGSIIGLLFYGAPGALHGATAGALLGFLYQICEQEVANAPAQLGTEFGVAAWDDDLERAKKAGIGVNPPNGVWLGLLMEGDHR